MATIVVKRTPEQKTVAKKRFGALIADRVERSLYLEGQAVPPEQPRGWSSTRSLPWRRWSASPTALLASTPSGMATGACLYIDLVQTSMDQDFCLTWGTKLGLPYQLDKQLYVQALQRADRGDVRALIRYATS